MRRGVCGMTEWVIQKRKSNLLYHPGNGGSWTSDPIEPQSMQGGDESSVC